MALTKPIMDSIVAFDATESHTFTFESIGGDQPLYNELKIYNSSGTLLKSHTQGSVTVPHYIFNNTISPSYLTNGQVYYATITTYTSIDGVISSSKESDKQLFYCYTTPTFTFNNVPQKVYNASYTFTATYQQAQNQYLSYWYCELYNNVNTKIATSQTYYVEKSAHTGSYPIGYMASHTFENLVDGQTYYIKIYGVTERQMVCTSTSTEFLVDYEKPTPYGNFTATNDSYNGQVIVESDFHIVNGTAYKSPTYTDDGIDLTNDNYVYWSEGLTIPKSFCIRMWTQVTDLGITLATFTTDKYILEITVNRAVVSGAVKDYFRIVGYGKDSADRSSKNTYLRLTSDFITPLNTTSKIFLYFAYYYPTNKYFFSCKVLSQEDTVLDWDGNSNVEYDYFTDIIYEDETETDYDNEPNVINYIGTISTVQIENAIFDHLNCSNKYTDYKSTDIPTVWSSTTLLNCNFDSTIYGGDEDLENIDSVKLMRQENGTTNWITLDTKSVADTTDLNFTYYDRYIPSGKDFIYAYVPLLNNSYTSMITTEITTSFEDTLYICDPTGVFRLFANVELGGETQNQQNQTLLPINSQYPIVIENSATNYKTGSVSGRVLGYEFEQKMFKHEYNRVLNRADAVQEKEDILAFLTNRKAKLIKDWNGNIYLCRITDSPSVSFESSTGNGTITVSFNFVEQGKWNNQSDLYYCGLVDTK